MMYLDFNSIKVRLNLGKGNKERILPLFQFHKGTIKPNQFAKCRLRALTFQFHKGTIKPSPIQQRWGLLFNFNSIKVRLNRPYALMSAPIRMRISIP